MPSVVVLEWVTSISIIFEYVKIQIFRPLIRLTESETVAVVQKFLLVSPLGGSDYLKFENH